MNRFLSFLLVFILSAVIVGCAVVGTMLLDSRPELITLVWAAVLAVLFQMVRLYGWLRRRRGGPVRA